MFIGTGTESFYKGAFILKKYFRERQCLHRSLTVFRMENLVLKLLLLVLLLQLSLVCALHNFFHAKLATLYVL